MRATQHSEATIRLRPIQPEDEEFLYSVYADTRRDEMAQTGWNDEQKDVFLRGQFALQHSYYQENYEGSNFDVIEVDGKAIGRLYVGRWDDEIRLIDIALFSTERRQGIGARLIRELLDEAGAAGKPARIHVERDNPAMSLYERFGFRKVGEHGVYHLMEWRAESEATST